MQTGSVADIVRRQARIRSQGRAVICRGRETSYGELDRRSNQVANGLIASGAKPGDRIAYLGKNNDIYFELLFGAAKARCVTMPLNWRLAAPEIAFIVGDASPLLIVIEPEFMPLLESVEGVRIIPIGASSDAYQAWRDAQPDDDPALPSDPGDTIVLMYTSGTTGLPKGVQLSNANLMSHLGFIDAGAFGPWDDRDIQLICLPIFHIGGTDSGLWSFHTGGTVLLLTDAAMPTLVDAFREHRVTVAGFVPTIMKSLLDHPDVATLDFSSLKLISYGGSPIAPEVMEQARETFGCRFQQLFGMTETTGGVAILMDEDHRGADRTLLRSCGRPLPGISIRIVDAQGADAPTGQHGEIAVRGPVVTRGYWQRPEETAKALRDGWYRTGDVGSLDASGYLFIHDRIKDMIVTGGENVYPTEVENALNLLDGVAEVAVIGVPDRRWGEAVKALVVKAQGHDPGEAAIIAFARTRLAGYKCPKSVEFVESLPRNAAGKVLRRELRRAYWGEGRQVG